MIFLKVHHKSCCACSMMGVLRSDLWSADPTLYLAKLCPLHAHGARRASQYASCDCRNRIASDFAAPMEHENCKIAAQTVTHEAAPRVISLTGSSAALLIEADLISLRSVLERRLEELESAKKVESRTNSLANGVLLRCALGETAKLIKALSNP